MATCRPLPTPAASPIKKPARWPFSSTIWWRWHWIQWHTTINCQIQRVTKMHRNISLTFY